MTCDHDTKPRRKRSMAAKKTTTDMTAKEYIRLCKKLDLSPGYSAAPALGISVTTAQRYRDGTWRVSETVAKLLRAMIKLGTTDI
jgi:hypothetical protein